jgi:hypothetical protein
MKLKNTVFTGTVMGLALLLGATSAEAAAGLNGAYYSASSGPGNVATALTDIIGTPTATFTATSVCFPSCSTSNSTVSDSDSLSQFLGGNAINLSPDLSGLSNHVVFLSGYIYIPQTSSYTFSLGSDDGSALWLGNSTAASPTILNDGDHGFRSVSDTLTLTAGFHSIEILQFEDGGVTGLSLVDENGAAISGFFTSPGIPEPATWAMCLAGLLSVGSALRFMRRRATEMAVAA